MKIKNLLVETENFGSLWFSLHFSLENQTIPLLTTKNWHGKPVSVNYYGLLKEILQIKITHKMLIFGIKMGLVIFIRGLYNNDEDDLDQYMGFNGVF